jgi:hypothetical protein
MPLSLRSFRTGQLAAIFVLGMALPVFTASAQSWDLVVTADSVIADPGEQCVSIPIYLENYADSIAGFELWLILDRSDIFEFQTYVETGAVTTYWANAGPDQSEPVRVPELMARMNPESYDHFAVQTGEITKVKIDTTGTLISGWQIIETRSLGGLGYDAKITCLANGIPEPYNPSFGYPNYGDMPYSQEDRTASIMISHDNFDNFGFSDPQGQLIGLKYDTLVDTTCYDCIAWDGDICLIWEPVSGTTGDSCVYDTSLVAVLDTTVVRINNGALTVAREFICGDANDDVAVNLLDATFLVNYLYRDGLPPEPIEAGDVDNSGGLNLFDATYLIDYLYKEGPAPTCP